MLSHHPANQNVAMFCLQLVLATYEYGVVEVRGGLAKTVLVLEKKYYRGKREVEEIRICFFLGR